MECKQNLVLESVTRTLSAQEPMEGLPEEAIGRFPNFSVIAADKCSGPPIHNPCGQNVAPTAWKHSAKYESDPTAEAGDITVENYTGQIIPTSITYDSEPKRRSLQSEPSTIPTAVMFQIWSQSDGGRRRCGCGQV